MLKYVLLWTTLLLGAASAQTPFPFVPFQVLGAAPLNAAGATKADATNGHLTTPTITGGTQTGPTINAPVVTFPTITGGTLDGTTLTGATLAGGYKISGNRVDVRAFGAKCDGVTNDSPAFTAAIASLTKGGEVEVPATGASCVLSTGIALGGASQSGVSLRGTAGAYWPGYDDNVEGHWTSFGSWIRCDDTVNACITVNGNGSAIDGLNFWYNQPTPSGSNCGATCVFTHDWNPINYPFTISIKAPQNFNHFSNINIINAANCIDIEGPDTGVASFFTYFDHMQLGCFNTGMKMLRVDNAISVHDVKFLVLWYQAFANVWGYMEGDTTVAGHKLDMDMAYVSDAAFSDVQFYQSWAAIRASTASVTSGLGAVTFAAQGLQFTNTVFNQVCQAIILGSGNPIVNGDFTNTVINIDPQTSFEAGQCGQATPIAFNLNSNNVDLSFTNINGFIAQQLFDVGGGTGGGVHLSGRNRISYSAYASGAPAIHVNAGGFADMAAGVNNLFPSVGAGPQCTGNCRNWPTVGLGDVWISGASGQARQQLFMTTTPAGVFQSRWGIKEDLVTEGGANTGSNFGIDRYADSGSFIDTPLQITRSTGVMIALNGLAVSGGVLGLPTYTVAGLPTCNGTTNINTFAVVTDATAPTYHGALTGGSTVHTKVLCTGAGGWVAD